MKIKEIVISNYKAIREMEISFGPGINLLIGDNGVGKTSVLEAITVAFGDFINGMPGVAKKGITATDVRIDTQHVSDASLGIVHYTPIDIQTVFDTKEGFKKGKVTRRDETSNSKTRFLGKEVSEYAKKITNYLSEDLPLFCYYSTNRLAPPKREDFGSASKNKLNGRRCGYIGCMENNLDIKALKSWCLKMEMAAFQQKKEIAEYQAFGEIVSYFMFRMNELEEVPTIAYSRAFEDIVYIERGETIPINYLSAGYQSVLWMIMDMAFRMADQGEMERMLVAAVENLQGNIPMREYGMTVSELSTFLIKFLNNHPEYFYLNSSYNYSYDKSSNIVTELRLTYKATAPKVNEMVAAYNSKVEEIISGVNPSWSDLEKALYVNDYLALHCEYDNSHTYHSSYDALIGQKAVCQGYALAYQELMNRLNIPCQFVSSDPLKHAWNLVQIAGNWYHVDVTWNDPVFCSSCSSLTATRYCA